MIHPVWNVRHIREPDDRFEIRATSARIGLAVCQTKTGLENRLLQLGAALGI